MPNKLSQFWQELKRRNVVRVITVYAGAAFVIIELINNITEPLHLPEWTPTLVIVLLAIGFPVVIIFSWIYDIHPEGGMVKTESADKVKSEDTPKSSNSWRIASYISFVVIVGLIVLNIIPRTAKKEILDKSIAVLPFQNDSPSQEMYFIDGVMEEILDNLCKIEDLRVVSRSSVEQYRDTPKPIPVVAEEMNVSYVLEGSGQRDGDNIRLTVQLLDAEKDQHIWSETYYREISNIFELQSEIAQLVAGMIQSTITPKEQELIEKIPTSNLTAYDYFQRGQQEFEQGNIDRAEELFHETLGYDSSYAEAFMGLAWIQYYRTDRAEYYSENYLDSVLTLVNKALSIDDQLYEAYLLRSEYYSIFGKNDLALADIDKAIDLNPNSGVAYMTKARFYTYNDFVKSIENAHKAIGIDRDQFLVGKLAFLGWEYFIAGFVEKSTQYYKEGIKLSGDSASYYYRLGFIDLWQGNYSKASEFLQKSIALGDEYAGGYLGRSLYKEGRNKEALEVFKDWIAYLKESNDLSGENTHRIAYAYWINGFEKEAEEYFDLQIEYCLGNINSNRPWADLYYTYYDLAAVYAFRGEKEKAFENLRIFNQIEDVGYWMVGLIKDDELFDSIRDEPEFQQIVQDVEAKYQASHERVRQWLEENEML